MLAQALLHWKVHHFLFLVLYHDPGRKWHSVGYRTPLVFAVRVTGSSRNLFCRLPLFQARLLLQPEGTQLAEVAFTGVWAMPDLTRINK